MFTFVLLIVGACYSFTTTQANVFPISGEITYSLSYDEAVIRCHNLGGSLATPTDLELARQTRRYTHCACGWLLGGKAAYPIFGKSGCGGNPGGLNFCNWRSTWDAFCFIGDPVGNCSRPLGMESGAISDSQVTASSEHRSFWGGLWKASFARLNKQGKINAWMPETDSSNEYIQIELQTPAVVTGIITQGAKRYFHKQFVTQYIVSYSKNARQWYYYEENLSAKPKVFSGNHDNNKHVRNMFEKPILARYLRISPIGWQRHITLRLELLGCDMSTYDEAISNGNFIPDI